MNWTLVWSIVVALLIYRLLFAFVQGVLQVLTDRMELARRLKGAKR